MFKQGAVAHPSCFMQYSKTEWASRSGDTCPNAGEVPKPVGDAHRHLFPSLPRDHSPERARNRLKNDPSLQIEKKHLS